MSLVKRLVHRSLRLSLVLLAPCAMAEIATLKLQDGSSIRGEIVSLKGGNYRVQSPALGAIDIKQSDVRIVEYGGAAARPSSPAAQASIATPQTAQPGVPQNAQLATQFQSLQQSMLSNPNIMQMVQGMQNDPSIQAVISDPEIQAAIQSGDYATLMANPKIHKLMNNSKVQAITREVR